MVFPKPTPTISIRLRHVEHGVITYTIGDAETRHVAWWKRQWKPLLKSMKREDAPDLLWNWRDRIEKARKQSDRLCLALWNEDAEILGGLIAMEHRAGQARLAPGNDLVFVQNLAIAPTWRPAGGRLVRGGGRTLVATAFQVADALGSDVRVGLDSKPGMEGFYEKLDMVDCGRSSDPRGTFRYFENQRVMPTTRE